MTDSDVSSGTDTEPQPSSVANLPMSVVINPNIPSERQNIEMTHQSSHGVVTPRDQSQTIPQYLPQMSPQSQTVPQISSQETPQIQLQKTSQVQHQTIIRVTNSQQSSPQGGQGSSRLSTSHSSDYSSPHSSHVMDSPLGASTHQVQSPSIARRQHEQNANKLKSDQVHHSRSRSDVSPLSTKTPRQDVCQVYTLSLSRAPSKVIQSRETRRADIAR